MASAVTTVGLFANAAIISWDHDPGATSALIVTPDGGTTKRYVAMALYGGFSVVAMLSVSGSSSGITLLDIVGATDAAGTNVTTIVSSGAVLADAVGDFVCLECTDEQIREQGITSGYNFTHVGARLTCSHAGDEAVVTYIRHKPKFAASGLTANVIA